MTLVSETVEMRERPETDHRVGGRGNRYLEDGTTAFRSGVFRAFSITDVDWGGFNTMARRSETTHPPGPAAVRTGLDLERKRKTADETNRSASTRFDHLFRRLDARDRRPPLGPPAGVDEEGPDDGGRGIDPAGKSEMEALGRGVPFER